MRRSSDQEKMSQIKDEIYALTGLSVSQMAYRKKVYVGISPTDPVVVYAGLINPLAVQGLEIGWRVGDTRQALELLQNRQCEFALHSYDLVQFAQQEAPLQKLAMVPLCLTNPRDGSARKLYGIVVSQQYPRGDWLKLIAANWYMQVDFFKEAFCHMVDNCYELRQDLEGLHARYAMRYIYSISRSCLQREDEPVRVPQDITDKEIHQWARNLMVTTEFFSSPEDANHLGIQFLSQTKSADAAR